MTKYLEFQNTQPAGGVQPSWGAFRWGDNIDSAYWLYNRTGDEWLLDLVTKMHTGSAGLHHRHSHPGTTSTWRRGSGTVAVLASVRRRAAPRGDVPELCDGDGDVRPVPGGGFAGGRELAAWVR